MTYAKDEKHKSFQKEEDAMARELEWLLVSQLPHALYDLKKGLKKCEAIMKSPEHDDSLGTNVLIIFELCSNDSLKGYVTLDGSDIIKGELQVKFPNYNRGNLVKLTIHSKNPYFIEQLVDAQNYITLALNALECSSQACTKESASE
ncbi:2111_t:CDS:2, partial [Acaulospora colombiana]